MMKIQNIKQQSGAILVLALVLLLVMTLMGITSMNVTTSELKIAANQQAHNNSYEAALSTLEAAKRSTTINWQVNNRALPAQTADTVGTNFDGTATIVYDHCLRGVAGNSLTRESQEGDSSASFGRVVQQIVAIGNAKSGSDITATTSMVNGVSAAVAYCP